MASKTSFNELSESEFKIYADGLLGNTRTAERRKEFISYLHAVSAKDRNELETLRNDAITKLRVLDKRQKHIETMNIAHQFDFAKTSYLFSSDDLTDGELETFITQANKTVYVHGKNYTGNIAITAANVTLDGTGNGKSAKTDSLVNTASFTGGITISANGCKLKGIDFTSNVEKAIVFTNGATNVTLQNCKFIADAAVANSKWWYGENYGTGNITIENCRIEGFKDSLLFDANTDSSVPTTRLDHVKIKDCYFKNNLGSTATRGVTTNPNKSVTYIGNKIETNALHASFWDAFEANNTKKVICKDNEFIFPVGQELLAGKKGVLQTWSKSDKPWIVQYSGNKVSNIKFGIKFPLTNGFYVPDTTNDDFLIDLTATHTNVTYGMSVLYKKNDGTQSSALKYHPAVGNQYTPVNIVAYPSIQITNPANLTIVQ